MPGKIPSSSCGAMSSTRLACRMPFPLPPGNAAGQVSSPESMGAALARTGGNLSACPDKPPDQSIFSRPTSNTRRTGQDAWGKPSRSGIPKQATACCRAAPMGCQTRTRSGAGPCPSRNTPGSRQRCEAAGALRRNRSPLPPTHRVDRTVARGSRRPGPGPFRVGPVTKMRSERAPARPSRDQPPRA
jgi:hypothetical protein